MLGLTGIPAVIELLLLPFFPESPRYMLIQRGDEKTAKKGEKTLKIPESGLKKNQYQSQYLVWPVTCSAAASAWLGQRGRGADRDAS